jgi:hypothetical protein
MITRPDLVAALRRVLLPPRPPELSAAEVAGPHELDEPELAAAIELLAADASTDHARLATAILDAAGVATIEEACAACASDPAVRDRVEFLVRGRFTGGHAA